MLVSWNWLKELVELPHSLEEVCEKLTVSGSEIESVQNPIGKLSGAVAAKVLSLKPHPSNGKLTVADLDAGAQPVVCVTGALNLSVGDMVPYGPSGSVMTDGTVLGDRDFSGVVSSGMMMSAEELGVPDAGLEVGILKLQDDTPIGSDIGSYLGLDDKILELSITPNRGDMLSMRGVAREIAALFPDSSMKSQEEPVSFGKPSWPMEFSGVFLEDDGCPIYSLAMADEVKVAPSPLWLRLRLSMAGIRPVNNVVDVTNLVMITLGQPLHAFDGDRLPNQSISVRRSKDGEVFTTLDHKDRVLKSTDIMICSGDVPVALAGVMGGLNSEIEDETSRILIESASFDSPRISSTSRRLGITSEASYRYSRGVDRELPERALKMALSLFEKLGCAVPAQGAFIAKKGDIKPLTVPLTKKKLHRIALWSDMTEASSILSALGFGLVEQKSDEMVFSVPSWRPDVSIEEDLIEEVARIRGYDQVPSRIPGCSYSRGDIGPVFKAMESLRCQAQALGYTEIVSYSFHSPKYLDILRLQGDPRGDFLTLTNPLSSDLSVMRSTMIPGLAEALIRTIRSGFKKSVRLFEMGRVFSKASSPFETDKISGLVYPGKDRRSPYGPYMEDDFLSVKADVESLALQRGKVLGFVQGQEPFGHLGQTAHILYDGSVIGFLARLKPSVERDLDLEGPVYCFELDMAPFIGDDGRTFKANPPYPPVFRDVSLLADQTVAADTVLEHIKSSSSELLGGVELFDIYSGKGIPEGKRSLAFSLSYRSPSRTLRDEEVDSIHSQVRKKLEALGYILR